MKKNNQNRNTKKLLQSVIIIFVVISLDMISAKLFIPKNSLYNDFRTQHSYYHHSLTPYQSCKTNINIQNDRHANILNVPYIESADYVVNTNSLGFIDKTIRDIKPTVDKKRIVFIGGSFVEGYGCSFDNTFAGILMEKYEKDSYDILNAGVVAYSPKLVYLKTKYLLEVLNLQIDELVVFANTFEIADEIIYEKFEPTIDKSDLGHSKLKNKIKNLISRNSYLYYAISEIYKGRNLLDDQSRPQVTVPLFEEIWPTKENFINERILWEKSPHYEKWGEKGLQLADKNISALFALCKAHGVEIVAVSHPIYEEIMENHMECMYSQLWEKHCLSNNAMFLNLYPVFMNNSLSSEETISKYYITGDGHWNENGHALIADFLFKNIK